MDTVGGGHQSRPQGEGVHAIGPNVPDPSYQRSVRLGDFNPLGTWTPDKEGSAVFDREKRQKVPLYIFDETGKRYLNDSLNVLWIKHLGLTVATPLVHTITGTISVAKSALKLVTFYHFWKGTNPEDGKSRFKARLADAGKDFLRIVFMPIMLVGLQLSAVYGLISPRDGRRLYATIERAYYGDAVLAPCFQPLATRHLLGGKIGERNQF